MKKILFYVLFLCYFAINAQDNYWTSYNFIVEPQNEATVYNLTDEYYTKNKPEGVTVQLYENHFNDSGNEFTHSIVFSGSLEALSGMYSPIQTDIWKLFFTRLNQHIKGGFSSATGNGIASYGGDGSEYPIRRLFSLKISDPKAYTAAFKKVNSKYNPDGRLLFLGKINSGHSPDGATHFVVAAFKDFKGAIGGVGQFFTDENDKAREKAWQEYLDTRGDVQIIRSSTRIRLGSW